MSHFSKVAHVSFDIKDLHDDCDNCDQQDDGCIVVVFSNIPPDNSHRLEDVERIKHVRDQNLKSALFWNLNITFSITVQSFFRQLMRQPFSQNLQLLLPTALHSRIKH